MVGASPARVVSFRDEKNTFVEIPRTDPRDKQDLWFSKVDIHKNTMMSKIRNMVKEKLIELLLNHDPCFNEPEFDTIGEKETQEFSSEAKEAMFLRKKAELIQAQLDSIMGLPQDEILAFLESSTLPAEFQKPAPDTLLSSDAGGSDEIPRLPQHQTSKDTSTTIAQDDEKKSADVDSIETADDSSDYFNWILDCDDEWEDLPALVKVNATEIGYTKTLWNEDNQDLPIFFTPWDQLTPNERTALAFLGCYDGPSWDNDVEIMKERRSRGMEETAAESSLPNSPHNNHKPNGVGANDDHGVEVADEEDDEISDFISNFIVDDTRPSVDDDQSESVDPMGTTRKFGGDIYPDDIEHDENISSAVESQISPPHEADIDVASSIPEEFVSNFVSPKSEAAQENGVGKKGRSARMAYEPTGRIQKEKEKLVIKDSVLTLLAEGSPNQEDDARKTTEDLKEAKILENSVVDCKPDKDENDEDFLMMEEFISNFVHVEETKEKANAARICSKEVDYVDEDSCHRENTNTIDRPDESTPLIQSNRKEKPTPPSPSKSLYSLWIPVLATVAVPFVWMAMMRSSPRERMGD